MYSYLRLTITVPVAGWRNGSTLPISDYAGSVCLGKEPRRVRVHRRRVAGRSLDPNLPFPIRERRQANLGSSLINQHNAVSEVVRLCVPIVPIGHNILLIAHFG